MTTTLSTTMTSTLTDEQNDIFDEAVIALSELSKNKTEITISADEVSELYEKQIENENSNIIQPIAGQKRKAPIASKCCNLCFQTFQVAAPQKKCSDSNCKGQLVLQAKEPKILKRAPPKCSKFCVKCDHMVENIATAIKKCPTCNSALENVEKKQSRQIVIAEAVVPNGEVLYGTGRNPWD